jgi:hypothetical protein
MNDIIKAPCYVCNAEVVLRFNRAQPPALDSDCPNCGTRITGGLSYDVVPKATEADSD